MRGRNLTSVAVRTALILAIGAAATVAAGGISSTVFAITASNDTGTASLSVDFSEGSWDPVAGEYTWSLSSPVDLVDPANPQTPVARLNSATLSIDLLPSPSMTLMLGVDAGATNTEFYVDSAVIDFPTSDPGEAEARFFASGQIWDLNGDGGYLVGLGSPGIGAFRSYYNGVQPDGKVFSHLVSAVMVGAGGSGSGSQSYPSTGYATIADAVGDMSLYAAFVVSGGDRASSSMSYGMQGVVPEPAACALLTLLGLAAGRRRS